MDFGPGETSRPPEGGADENQEKVATRPHGKVKKSVRFLNATPQDRRQEEDHPEEVGDEDEEAAEQESHRIDVNIPTRSGSISFNETGARRGLMQTPGECQKQMSSLVYSQKKCVTIFFNYRVLGRL